MYIIYQRLNKINNKSYIGRTERSLDERSGKNGYSYLQKDINGNYTHPKFANAILKYGWENFDSIILETVETYKESIEREHYYILKYDSVINGYNCNYGESNTKEKYFSDETLRKLSEAHKKENLSNEAINNYRNAHLGRSPWNKGIHSEKLSNSKKGINNPMYGKVPYNKGLKISKERLDDMRKAAKHGKDNKQSKPVVAVNPKTFNIEYEFDSIADASKFFKQKNETAIISCLKGRTKTSAGYIWKYKE